MDRLDFIHKREKAFLDLMTENGLKAMIADSCRDERQDLDICIGELSELTQEITRYYRGDYNREDFMQELSHVQWAVWRLQIAFKISDEELTIVIPSLEGYRSKDKRQDINFCVEKLAELIQEITRYYRGKYIRKNFLQKLANVQLAVWKLQRVMKISDKELRASVQGSFRKA